MQAKVSGGVITSRLLVAKLLTLKFAISGMDYLPISFQFLTAKGFKKK
jgi:hypothetical protein